MQPFYRPELTDLIERRIDVLQEFEVEVNGSSQKELCFCQGKVTHVYDDKTKSTVKVEWDAMPDVDGCDQTEETDQVLLPT